MIALQIQRVESTGLNGSGNPPRPHEIFGIDVHPVDREAVSELVREWALRREGRYVCFAAVATIIFARDSVEFRQAIAGADLVLPDGMPLVWALRRSGMPDQPRLCGPDLVFSLCADAANLGIPVGFYGSTPEVLDRIGHRLGASWPSLDIRYTYSPPFRELTAAEEAIVLEDVNRSGIGFLFVGLGCPKQEIWMARVKDRSRVVMFGIGGAFDIAAGVQRSPPKWMQRSGLQWLHRVLAEPRRLWRRYLFQNTRFILMVIRRRLSPPLPSRKPCAEGRQPNK